LRERETALLILPTRPADVAQDEWERDFAVLESEWTRLGGPVRESVVSWELDLAAMEAKMLAEDNAGRWTSDRVDLLSVARRAGDELVHSNILKWLLTPVARHGLRGALLADLLVKTWGIELDPEWSVRVRREVPRADATRSRIADLVVEAGSLRLVIENKVYSKEDRFQCEDLFVLWTTPHRNEAWVPETVRFVLLSRHGRPPESAVSADAIAAWQPLSYAWVAEWLLAHVGAVEHPVARSTVVQYLVSLRKMSRRSAR
jgi:PD-(D/E)XK nuclease superfamily protein